MERHPELRHIAHATKDAELRPKRLQHLWLRLTRHLDLHAQLGFGVRRTPSEWRSDFGHWYWSVSIEDSQYRRGMSGIKELTALERRFIATAKDYADDDKTLLKWLPDDDNSRSVEVEAEFRKIGKLYIMIVIFYIHMIINYIFTLT